MSWDSYVQNLMASSDGMKKAAIVSLADGSVWAKSDEFKASTAEVQNLVALYSDDLKSAPEKGFDLEGVHYVVPRAEAPLLFGKKGEAGVFAFKTNQTVVVVIYHGDRNTSKGQECRTAVEKMGEYLLSNNF